MPASTIIVQYRDGSPCSHTLVVLGFSSGMSREAYTNSHGEATVEHSSTGRATIYVSGKECGHFHTPGQTSVVVS